MVWYIRDAQHDDFNVAEIELFWKEIPGRNRAYSQQKAYWTNCNLYLDCHFHMYVPEIFEWCLPKFKNFTEDEFKQFCADIKVLSDIRLWMFELSDIQSRLNHSSSREEDSAIYDEVYQHIDKLMNDFAEKYDLKVVID